MYRASVPYENGTRIMSKEEWLLLSDYENDFQETKHTPTSIFSTAAVCTYTLVYLYIFNLIVELCYIVE